MAQGAPNSHRYARMRRYERHGYDARIKVLVFRDGKTTELWGRTNELGMDGVSATLNREVGVGEVVSLEILIPIVPFTMKVRAIVRYTDGLRCGFEFLVVSQEQRETMRQLCGMLSSTT